MEQEAPNRANGVLGDTLAFAGRLERLVMDFEKLRGQALRNARLNRAEVHLLRLAAQPRGVGLGQFRDQLGVTDQRASQIARALEARQLLKSVAPSPMRVFAWFLPLARADRHS